MVQTYFGILNGNLFVDREFARLTDRIRSLAIAAVQEILSKKEHTTAF